MTVCLLRIMSAAYTFCEMNLSMTIDPDITMRELLEQFPGAQRAMFRKYHIGGCASCGFSPEETLAGVCARNENVDVGEAIDHILASDAAERAMQIEPRALGDKLQAGEKLHLLDVRTREEWESVKLPAAHLFTQELMQEILSTWSREEPVIIYDHQGNTKHGCSCLFPRSRPNECKEPARRDRCLCRGSGHEAAPLSSRTDMSTDENLEARIETRCKIRAISAK